ncbi:MAG: c-type cytochrome, partial [Opitutae bacterium]|nr:c-type cytochrome [Opitutae bacterium]
ELAKSDPSPVVRLYLASALQRTPKARVWDMAAGLLSHAGDADDHNIPKMVWFGVEPLVPENPLQAMEVASNSRIPLVSQFIARRATSGKLLEAVVDSLAASTSSALSKVILEGMRDGLLGQRDLTAPANWSSLESELLKNADMKNLTLQVGQLFGSAEAGRIQLVELNDPATPVERRQEILRTFAQTIFPPAVESILGYVEDPDLRLDALRTLASYEERGIPETILRHYSEYTADEKMAALQTLATRRDWGRTLLNALRRGAVPRSDVSAVTARQMRRVVGPNFVDWWGPMESLEKDKQLAIDRYKFLLTDDYLSNADLTKGKAVYAAVCASCHKMYGEGGEIGPDITGSNRADLDYILTNTIDPNGEVAESYQLVTITTQDGRTYAGNVYSEDDQRVTLRLVGQDMIIAKPEILSRQTSPLSMMPEGLLNTLSDSQVRDLISYLRITHPIK